MARIYCLHNILGHSKIRHFVLIFCFSMVWSRVTLSLHGCTSVNIVFLHMDSYAFAGIAVALVTVILIMGGVIVVLFIYKCLKVGPLWICMATQPHNSSSMMVIMAGEEFLLY